MLQKLGLTFIALTGFGLVLWGSESLDRFANAAGHGLILLALILGIWMNSRSSKEKDKKTDQGNPLANTDQSVSKKMNKDKLQRLPK